MKKLLVIAAIAALSSAACATTPGGGGGGGGGGGPAFSAGCYDSSLNTLSLIYDGSIATYKNVQVATNSTGCGSVPTTTYVTLVLAADQSSALAACQAGPDPAATAATGLAALGFDSMPANGWICTHPGSISAALLQPHDCFGIGTASVEYLGPRNTFHNAVLHDAGSTTCASAVVSFWTYVQQSTQAAALLACVSIDPTFTTATSLASVFPTMPNDTYLCQ
jgi:hypothetical protein